MVLWSSLLEGPLPLRQWKRHTFTNDIKDINQGTSYPQVMNKQAKGKRNTENIVWAQISVCVQKGVDADGIEIEAGPVKIEWKFPTCPTLPQTHKYLLGGMSFMRAFTFSKNLLSAPPSAWQNLARFGSYMLIKQEKMVFSGLITECNPLRDCGWQQSRQLQACKQ